MQSDIDPTAKKELLHIVKRLLAQRSVDQSITEDDDLREAGLTSLDMVDLVLCVESELKVKIPTAAITPANFRSIQSASSEALQAGIPRCHWLGGNGRTHASGLIAIETSSRTLPLASGS